MSVAPFKAGGALTDVHTAVYVERQADQDALLHLRAMDYLLVVEPRQQGKTSLINSLACRQALSDTTFAYADVTTPSRSNEATWYQTLSPRILRQLHDFIPPNRRPVIPISTAGWRDFLCDVARSAVNARRRVVIALDEIGAVTFPGATEFFSVLRDVYNSRQAEPELKQLTFLLSGAFHPRDLIQDDRISPFNIAQRVRLTDFTLEQVQDLVSKGSWTHEQGEGLAERIYHWTDGQPYLTQLLCRYLDSQATPADVDIGVNRLRREDENHLPPMLERLNSNDKLSRYVGRVLVGEQIKFYPGQNRRQAQLELLGVLKGNDQGFCMIRNRIYEHVLNPQNNLKPWTSINKGGRKAIMEIPRELLEEVRKGNVVLMCGAGISVSQGGLPSGGQLAQEMAARAGLGDVGRMTLPEVAQAYELEMGTQSLIAYVTSRIEDAGHVPLTAHQLIAQLPFKRIITTNWDTLLEEAWREAKKPVVKVVRDPEIAYADEGKILLIKLHGSVEQKDTLVITGDDYYDVFSRLPETANLVRSYFATQTVLFLGFGLADEDFKRLYHEVVRHLGKHKRRAYAVQLNPTPLTQKYWQQKNVQVIAADAAEFLEEVSRQLGTIAEISPGSQGKYKSSPPTPRSSTSVRGDLNLERGLEALKNVVKEGAEPDVYLTFMTLESRLLANLHDERIYGTSENVRSERARIVLELNRLALAHAGCSFNELCQA